MAKLQMHFHQLFLLLCEYYWSILLGNSIWNNDVLFCTEISVYIFPSMDMISSEAVYIKTVFLWSQN